jgi:hypothetical protein
MKTYQVQILEPKATKLLQDLANLKLIKIKEIKDTEEQFFELVEKLRSKPGKKPSLKEITKEVEIVRSKRYATKENL